MISSILNPIIKRIPENNQLERIWILAKVDFKSRYYYHALGVLWALIRPLVELVVYYLIFSTIFESTVENFALYLFSGLIAWYFFVEGTSKGLTVFTAKRYLIESIQFNKIDLFISSTISAFLGFLFNLSAYLLVSLFFNAFPLNLNFFYFILLIFNVSILILGFSLIISTLSIYFKDIQHLWDMIILAGFWMTPIVYDAQLMMDKFPALIYANPLAGLMINIRHTLLYNSPPDFNLFIYNFVLAIVVLIIGVVLFNKFSSKAAEKF